MHVCVCMSVFVHASKLLNERAVTVAEEKESLVNTKEGRDPSGVHAKGGH